MLVLVCVFHVDVFARASTSRAKLETIKTGCQARYQVKLAAASSERPKDSMEMAAQLISERIPDWHEAASTRRLYAACGTFTSASHA